MPATDAPVVEPPRLEAEPSDDELVGRARAGDARALDRLTTRHLGAVYRVVLGIVGDPDLAADATQDACVNAVRALPGFRGEASYRSWVLAIAANEARTHLRRLRARPSVALQDAPPLVAPGPTAEEGVVVADEGGRMRAALQRLPEKQRRSVELRVYEGLSFREIGTLIDSSEGAARVNYHHGVRRLRELLNP